jgi:hypothetical protein
LHGDRSNLGDARLGPFFAQLASMLARADEVIE